MVTKKNLKRESHMTALSRLLGMSKEPSKACTRDCGYPFIRDIKVLERCRNVYLEARMMLDTGCEVRGVITDQAVAEVLNMSHEIVTFGSTDREEQGFILLNGEMLYPYGEITLQWTGKSFRRMFVTTFLVISGDKPWQIILGAPTIHEYGIMKVTGLGGMVPLPRKKSAEEHAKDKERKKQHADEVAANNAKVATHKKDKQQDARHASAKKAKDSRSSK